MKKNTQRTLNIAMVTLSWLTLPLLGFRTIKRFLPASLLIVFIEFLHSLIGKKRRWWYFYNKPNSIYFGEMPFQIGPFLAISLWILKYTFGRFGLFLLVNGITNFLFTYPFINISSKLKFFTLVRLSKFQFFLYFFSKAFLLYVIQTLFELKRKTTPINE